VKEWCRIGCGIFLLLSAPLVGAVSYYEDSRSNSSDVPGLPHYRSPEEACITGELERRVQGYQENDNRQYRYISANVGTDDGFGEFSCQGVIERSFYYSGVNWVTVEEVATLVYGPFGANETCTLGGYQDPETGQCGPPKCTDQCCGSGCGNGSNPIQTASGNKHQVETDYVGTGPFPLVFNRTYDSQRTWLAVSPPMGIGWTHRYLAHVAILPPQGGSTLSEAVVYRPDGRIQRFNLAGTAWVSDADVSERLSVTVNSSGDYVSATYTTNEDEVETYDQQGRLASIANRGGFVQTLSYTTGPANSASTISHNALQKVTDPEGRSLTFGYNTTTGQLTSLTENGGAVIAYAYDANGNLQTVTYPETTGTSKRTYTYNETGQTSGASLPNALTGIIDESAQRFASWGYNAAGHATLSVHGAFTGGTIDRTAFAFNANGSDLHLSEPGAILGGAPCGLESTLPLLRHARREPHLRWQWVSERSHGFSQQQIHVQFCGGRCQRARARPADPAGGGDRACRGADHEYHVGCEFPRTRSAHGGELRQHRRIADTFPLQQPWSAADTLRIRPDRGRGGELRVRDHWDAARGHPAVGLHLLRCDQHRCPRSGRDRGQPRQGLSAHRPAAAGGQSANGRQ
jgi:YD repeat-containing protein